MSQKSKRHTHKYHYIPLAGTKVWACSLPDCLHYMPKHMEAMVEGKNTYCWECDKEFRLDREAMASDKPKCYECRHPEVKENMDDILKLLENKI